MSSEVSSPLKGIIERLASAQIQGPAVEMKKRMKARFAGATAAVAVLCDCSDSMTDLIGSQNMRKCDHLKIALDDVLVGFPGVKLIAFSYVAKEIPDARHLPEPGGSTDLAAALKLAKQWKPRKTIVISDGLPNSEDAALKAAEALTGSIDTIYCGPEAHPALEFLRKLARDSGGIAVAWDGFRTSISDTIRGLLPAPE